MGRVGPAAEARIRLVPAQSSNDRRRHRNNVLLYGWGGARQLAPRLQNWDSMAGQ
jgi:hypothetical protein